MQVPLSPKNISFFMHIEFYTLPKNQDLRARRVRRLSGMLIPGQSLANSGVAR